MDNITPEKKPKRPRIGEMRTPVEDGTANYERAGYGERANHDNSDYQQGARPYQPRQYQPRPYNRYNQGDGAQNRYNNGVGQYRQRPYQQGFNNVDNANTENTTDTSVDNQQSQQQQNNNYRPRRYNNYNNNYNNYNNNYNNGPRRQNGYNNYRQNGYNNYNNGMQRQGGYNNNGQQRPGGYNNNGQQRPGGYNNRQQRPGAYNPNQRQGGYNNRQQKPYNRNNRNNNNNGFPGKGKSFVPRPKPVEYEMPIPDPNEQIRLNKFMANAGICSRREADEFIQQGLVKINGNVVTELGTKVLHSDIVEYDDKVVALERKCYILLNKPKDCVTTSDDPNGRLTVMDLVKGACNERIYPVGRLDRNTTGVLLLTNDGDLASKLTHPQYVKKKIYHVWTDKDISEEDMQRIADGIELEDGEIHADAISYATETDRNQAGIEIHSGRNRIVRRIFESLGYHVTKLDRVYFAGLTKKNLPRGRWRYLSQQEVNFLKMGSFE